MTSEEFIRVYLPLGSGLYRVAFRLLGSREEAEDAVQDLYIRLWNTPGSQDRVNNPQAWCLTVLRNLCIDRLRTRAGQKEVPVYENIPGEEMPERSDRLERVLEVIRTLSPKNRELLRLRLVEGLSFVEISRMTGLGETALRVAFHRLKNKLKKI